MCVSADHGVHKAIHIFFKYKMPYILKAKEQRFRWVIRKAYSIPMGKIIFLTEYVQIHFLRIRRTIYGHLFRIYLVIICICLLFGI